jgi:hypothetical protein
LLGLDDLEKCSENDNSLNRIRSGIFSVKKRIDSFTKKMD